MVFDTRFWEQHLNVLNLVFDTHYPKRFFFKLGQWFQSMFCLCLCLLRWFQHFRNYMLHLCFVYGFHMFRMEFIDVSNEERLYGSLGFDFDSLGCMQWVVGLCVGLIEAPLEYLKNFKNHSEVIKGFRNVFGNAYT